MRKKWPQLTDNTGLRRSLLSILDRKSKMGVLNNNNSQGHIGPPERWISEASGQFKKSMPRVLSKGSSRPALSFAEGKAAVLLAASRRGRPLFARGAYFQYVSTGKWRPACAKPLRRRQGTLLAAFFNSPFVGLFSLCGSPINTRTRSRGECGNKGHAELCESHCRK